MKKAFLFTLLLTCFKGLIVAQHCKVKKGYAYERSTLSGTPPRKVVDESGNQLERPVKNNTNYLIYIEVKNNCSIQPQRIWINGRVFNVTAEEVNSPVVINYEQPGIAADTLVKRTNNKIIKLQPTAQLTEAEVLQKAQNAKIIIEYIRNSRIHYHAIKEIKKMPPLVLQ